MPVNQRIKEFQEKSFPKQKEFAELIGISESTLSSVYTRDGDPSLKVIKAVLNGFPELNARWLLTGKGEMILKSESSDEKTKDTEGCMMTGGCVLRRVAVMEDRLEKIETKK